MKYYVFLVLLLIPIIICYIYNNPNSNKITSIVKISPYDVNKIFSETYKDWNLEWDTQYTVYPYSVTLKYLDKACKNAWSLIESNHIEPKVDKYDCEDEAMLILSLLRLKLINVPCFIYIMWNPASNQGHAMIACVVEKDGKLERLYYDVNCEEKKGFILPAGYIAYLVG